MDVESDSRLVFNNLSTKFSQLLHGRTEGDRSLINKTLDDLNSLDYRYPVVTNLTRAVLLSNQCCNLVPPDDSFLVAKCCSLLTNLIIRQHVVIEGRTLSVLIEWILQSLKQCDNVVTIDILVTLEGLLRSNVQNIYTLLPLVVLQNGPLLKFCEQQTSPEIILLSTQCLEAACLVPENNKKLDNQKCLPHYDLCCTVFLDYLKKERSLDFDGLIHAKILMACIKGLQNIIINCDDYLVNELGIFLGISKTYMAYQLKGIDFLVPQRLLPSALSIPEPSPNKPREKKGGKVTKQRKQKLPSSAIKDIKKPAAIAETDTHFNGGGYIPATSTNLDTTVEYPTPNLYGNKLTSDSEFSDTESGRTAKIGIMEGRVRQSALNLLLTICKQTDKRTIFSYWSSFIPDAPITGSHSLTICILKDPSPRARMAALNVLLSLLSSSKLYLSQAEYSDRTSAFIPFSVILGSMIKELHHCLSLALNESSYLVLTQALKCMVSLVQATPYHRLAPGLTSKVIRNVKTFIYHKDATVQVVALIVLGCILASEPTVKETQEAFLKNIHEVEKCEEKPKLIDDNFDYADFSSDDDDVSSVDTKTEIPWLLQRCLANLSNLSKTGMKENEMITDTTPAPVKLESLQVISAMSRNYFNLLILPHLAPISRALEVALSDKYMDVRMHGGRTLDFIGQAMHQHLTNETVKMLSIDQSLAFWQTLLNGALIKLLQNEEFPAVRTIACDCISSIGGLVFEQLPREKQILCITLLFACSRDEDNTVKGAAVRALAICVLYPSLREDTGFIMDTAEVIHRTLEDENIGLRIKASWSLGNLSDALVSNKSDNNVMEDIPDSLLLYLIRDGVKGCADNFKIQSNTVRALGNLLQLINPRFMEDAPFREATENAVTALVKCCTTGSYMKVRWNSCYAIGNVLKNDAICTVGNNWLHTVFKALMELVISFKNFKVRINAALALSSCTKRCFYGNHYISVWNSLVKALENSENMDDFSEFKHRDHLVEQICLSLGHLVTLLKVEDLTCIMDTFSETLLKTHMQRVYDRLVPEKSTILFSAQEHLLTFKNLSNEQKELVGLLQNIFNNDVNF